MALQSCAMVGLATKSINSTVAAKSAWWKPSLTRCDVLIMGSPNPGSLPKCLGNARVRTQERCYGELVMATLHVGLLFEVPVGSVAAPGRCADHGAKRRFHVNSICGWNRGKGAFAPILLRVIIGLKK